MEKLIRKEDNYKNLVYRISDTYLQGQKNATISVNSHLVQTYWKIGQYIVEFEIGEKASHLLSWSHYVDLVFYHRFLKCFVLIDLKKEEAGYEDVGQMNMYLGYFENEENTEGDNSPIGIVLAKEKDDLLIQYALHNISSQLFVNKYQLYLPNENELRAIINEQIK
jgi:hypothetical protein